MITQERLKEILHYNPASGLFVWKINIPGVVAIDDYAGHLDTIGYIIIKIDGKKYKAHRLAFLYMTGKIPAEVDHKNGITNNNSWSNLRQASRSENCRNARRYSNNKSGHKGVYWHARSQRWVAKITVNKKVIQLGTFVEKSEAVRIRKQATLQYHGEFARIAQEV